MTENELQIIKDCQNGNLERFAELYDFYIHKIYNFIYYRVGHRQTAEDIASTVFMKAISKIGSFSALEGSFSSWLYKIARNKVIDHYRTRRTEIDIESVWDLPGEDFSEKFDANLKLAEIKKYLENFSAEQREIIMLRIWDGLSYQEISAITGKSEGSLKMAVSRVIKKIRQEKTLIGLFVLLNLL